MQVASSHFGTEQQNYFAPQSVSSNIFVKTTKARWYSGYLVLFGQHSNGNTGVCPNATQIECHFMPPTEHQFDIKKIIRWFAKEEVKTPLSFFFKVIPYMTAAWVAILYAPGVDSPAKIALIKFSAWIFFGLSSLVGGFAFFRPKNLVYGETGHRAEKKIEYGTEKRTYTSEEFNELESSRNTRQITSNEGQSE